MPAAAIRMSSILVVEGAALTKLNGGGVRSRVVLASLQELGRVHVISIAKKSRHVDSIDSIEGVETHSVIVANHSKWHDIRRFFREALLGRPAKFQTVPDANAVTRKIETLVKSDPNIQILAFRYINAWELSHVAGHPILKQLCVWLDLDDRADKILLGKMRASRFWLWRKLAVRAYEARKGSVELAAREAHLCSLASASDIQDFAVNANVQELANVVPTPDSALELKAPSASQDLLFLGSYAWPPNVSAITWFIDNCWKEISAQFPKTKLQVVGTGKRSIRDALSDRYRSDTSIVWHHNAFDLHMYYAGSRLVISPVEHGSGSKIKVIEAAAFARPTVVTPHSARGLHPTVRKDLKIAETASNFAEHCIRYLQDQVLADRHGAALAQAQRAHHSEHSFSKAAFKALLATKHAPLFPNEVIAKYALTSPQSNEIQS